MVLILRTNNEDDAGYQSLPEMSCRPNDSKFEFQIRRDLIPCGNEPNPDKIQPFFNVERNCKPPSQVLTIYIWTWADVRV